MNATTLDYQNLVIKRVQKKYPALIIGIIVSYFLSSFLFIQLGKIKFFSQKKVDSTNINKNVQQKIYVVQEGDDLWKIAEKTFGSGYNAYDISIANKITDPNSIAKGQKLFIPSIASKQTTITEGNISATMTSQVTFKGNKYVVKDGDFLWKIALEVYGDGNAWQRLADFNKISFPYSVETGMILKVPR